MGGRASRAKGMRGEYKVRDYFRSFGWEANRVPSSGAAEGFKGDVVLTKEGRTLRAEVKYHENFHSVYALVEKVGGLAQYDVNGTYVTASYEFDDLGFEDVVQCRLYEGITIKTPGIKKLIGLQKFVKTCDFLVLIMNFHPLLFIRFRGEHAKNTLPISSG